MTSPAGGLLCHFGRHRPAAGARWNQGYGFTRCERCGCDLVRSMISPWQRPRGLKVVWRSAEPEAAAAAPVPAAVPTAEPTPVQAAAPPPEPIAPPPPVIDHREEPGTDTGTDKVEAPVRSPFDFGDFDEPGSRDDDDRPDASGEAPSRSRDFAG